MSKLSIGVAATALIVATAGTAAARDQIQIAGSSTVLPYATIVAEAFGENFPHPTPVVESGGSSAGLKRFCEGVGPNTTDIANSSRLIRESEVKTCAENGVTEIMEVRFGYDGIVFASQRGGPSYAFTPTDWFEALAAEIPGDDGKMYPNPNTTWRDVNPDFPEVEIAAFIPGTKHGTREVFEEKVLAIGCEESGALEKMTSILGDEDAAEDACIKVRTDGVSVDIDGDYTETLSRINSNPRGIGVFGLSFYENNTDKLQVATMNGIVPTQQAIATGEYPVSRPLQFYVKKAHIGVIPGLKEYVSFFVSDAIAGQGGPLSNYGLVPDPALAEVQGAVEAETTMGMTN